MILYFHYQTTATDITSNMFLESGFGTVIRHIVEEEHNLESIFVSSTILFGDYWSRIFGTNGGFLIYCIPYCMYFDATVDHPTAATAGASSSSSSSPTFTMSPAFHDEDVESYESTTFTMATKAVGAEAADSSVKKWWKQLFGVLSEECEC